MGSKKEILMNEKTSHSNFCEIFHYFAKTHPLNIAVIFNENRMTYAELDSISSDYAYRFKEIGLKKGDIIAISIFSSIDLIPLILGIWKAGGVYLPVDPNYPKKRIDLIRKTAKPKIWITSKELKKGLNFSAKKVFLIDQQKDKPKKRKLPTISKSDFAYVMFTSGTTGDPKGIVVNHQGLAHAARAFKSLFPKRATALAAGSISFDPNLLTIVFCLANGNTICLYDNREGVDIEDAEQIIKIIQANSISFILSTPTFYSKILESNSILPSLKNIVLCGEKIPRSIFTKHVKVAANAFLYNAYGPTEYAMGSTIALLFDPKLKKISPITIGKSFYKNKVYILNSRLEKTKVNEKGEIYVGGPGLAVGYLNQGDLTDKKFVWIKSLGKKALRLYRTGDVGYYLPSGDLVYIGRSDFQIKLKGHRVEIEEIESAINDLPYIEQSFVIAKNCASKGTKLTAFVKANQKCTQKQLKTDLLAILPSYMLPSQLIKIKTFPVTKNGKIDRELLKERIR